MDDAMKPIRVSTLATDGSKVPFSGTGARFVVAPDTWIAVDFDFDRHVPVSVQIGGRCRRERGASWPNMTLEIHAGNSVSVHARSEQNPDPSASDAFIVDRADLKGDIGEWLKKTTSGDPLGEVALGQETRAPLASDTFQIDYDDIATIQVAFSRALGALLSVRVTEENAQLPPPETHFRSLSMTIKPHACNLVSLRFREVQAFRPGPLA